MINLLEEEYNATSGKYILHLTMGAGDTSSDLPSAEKPFNSSNYSCFFDYGEPAENSTAVDEASGKVYLYSNGEWAEPEAPAGETKVAVIYGSADSSCILVNGEAPTSVSVVPPIINQDSNDDVCCTVVDVGDVVTIVMVGSNDKMLSSIVYKDGTTEEGPSYATEDKTITITEDMLVITVNEFEK